MKVAQEATDQVIDELRSVRAAGTAFGREVTRESVDRLLRSGAILVLAQEGEHTVGTVTLLPLHLASGLRGYIDELVVSTDYTGHGLDKALLHEAMNQAREAKMLAVHTHTTVENVQRYEKSGLHQKDAHLMAYLQL
nr:GNAT family N-acetyltransferase [Streptomyces sp. CS131]